MLQMPPPTGRVRNRGRSVTPSNQRNSILVSVQGSNSSRYNNTTIVQSSTHEPWFVHDPSLPEGVPKLNLTPEEELEILERLDSEDFDPHTGWGQFLDPIQKKERNRSAAGKSKFRANLNRDFENAEISAIPGMTGVLHETRISKDDDDDEKCTERTYDLPIHFQKVDQLMKSVDEYRQLMERTVDAIAEMYFTEIFPQSCGDIIEKMEKAVRLLENFMKQSTSSTTKLLVHEHSPKKNHIYCPIEKQSAFISVAYNLSDQMKNISKHLANSKSGFELEDRLCTLEKIIQCMEHNVQEAEKNMKKIEENETIRKTLVSNFNHLPMSSDEDESENTSSRSASSPGDS